MARPGQARPGKNSPSQARGLTSHFSDVGQTSTFLTFMLRSRAQQLAQSREPRNTSSTLGASDSLPESSRQASGRALESKTFRSHSTIELYRSLAASHEFSQRSSNDDWIRNNKLQTRNMTRAKTNDKLLRYLQKTQKLPTSALSRSGQYSIDFILFQGSSKLST
jgi:hypothetical protein